MTDRSRYPHPYTEEIAAYSFPERVNRVHDPILSKPWDETAANYVNDANGLRDMMEELKRSSEIAVDLEHHDQHSYYGIVCLMQISTRDTDYIVDTLSLRGELEVLNEVLTDPKILKVTRP